MTYYLKPLTSHLTSHIPLYTFHLRPEEVRPARFERATCSSGGCRSIHLSYGRILIHRTESDPEFRGILKIAVPQQNCVSNFGSYGRSYSFTTSIYEKTRSYSNGGEFV